MPRIVSKASVKGRNRRGQALVSSEGSNLVQTVRIGSPKGRSTLTVEDREQRGRRVSAQTVVGQVSSGSGLTAPAEEPTVVTGCPDDQGGSSSQSIINRPEPGKDPEPEEAPPPPPENPDNPSPAFEPPSPTYGCGSDDPDQWYLGGCPAGTTEKGFATLSGGETYYLCGGPQRPPGDGCPIATTGWSCIDGTCQEAPDGTYASLAECQSSCQPSEEPEEVPTDDGYTQVGGLCLPSATGEYGNLQGCLDDGGTDPDEPDDPYVPPDFIPGARWVQYHTFENGNLVSPLPDTDNTSVYTSGDSCNNDRGQIRLKNGQPDTAGGDPCMSSPSLGSLISTDFVYEVPS